MDNALAFLQREIGEWADATFGADITAERPLAHLAEEVAEAQANPRALEEYVDCFMLIIEAARRAGFTTDQLLVAALIKLALNKRGDWYYDPTRGYFKRAKT